MFFKLLHTRHDGVLTVIRLTLGAVFFAHGAQKVLGWFGGPGFRGTMAMFGQMHIPSVLAFLAISAEFLGGLGLILGFMGRIAALGIITNMLVAIALVHAPNGLFMNWTGTQAGEGFEFHLLAIAMGIAIVVRGCGAASLDLALSRTAAEPAVRLGGPRAA